MARGKIQGYVEKGGNTVTTDGRVSTTQVQRSFPLATVTIFDAGTANISTIFSNEAGTPKANPFIADIDGFWFFWADAGRYDVQFSGAGISAPFTIFGIETIIAQGTALLDPGGNGFVVRTALNTTVARSIEGTTSAIVVTNGNGVSGNAVINLDTSLNFAGKTISGGTFVSPGIANFQNAIHDHDDATGGGQLNATNVFSAGTVPVARLPIMVGATGGTPGVAGLVPAPAAGEQNNFLRGDGTWQVTGGGGGTPGSPNLSLQYNNGGAFGGVTGTSSDGTQVTWTAGVLRATSPRFTTDILDTNGNAIITLNALGSAVNNFQIANAAAGGHPVLAAIGASADINIVLTPKGAGIVDTAGNFRITNNAPQITLIDANDSKTVRISVSGANWDFTNDTLGSVPIRIDTTNNLVTLAGNLTINNANPTIIFDDTAGTDARIHHDASILRFGTTGADQITLTLATGVADFTAIPTIPTSTPTTAGQVVSKQTLDNAELPFSVNWFEFDPSASTTSTEDRPGFLVPDNVVGGTITKALISFSQGSALAGGDNIVFTFRRRTSGGASSDWATATLTSAHAIQNVHVFDITNQALSAADRITYFISSRTGTINPRALSLSLQGIWKRTNP